MADGLTLIGEELTISGTGGILISDLSLTARTGDVLGITGPSGSGKTSLLHVLGGLAAPDSGRVLLGGRPVSLWRETALGLVLQHLHLLPVLTAHEAVALPMQARGLPRAEITERADRTLAAVGLGDHLAQQMGELSGGQRQRVAVARALAGGPELILADEPGAALDPHWRGVVLELLADAARDGATVIIASGDPEQLERCGRILTLS